MVSVKFNVFSLKMFYARTIYFLLKYIFSIKLFAAFFRRHLCNRISFFKVKNNIFSRYKFLEDKYNHIALVTCRIL